MSNTVKILEVTENLFSQSVIVEALNNCREEYNSFLGPRIFFLNKGKRIKVKIPKSNIFYKTNRLISLTYAPLETLSHFHGSGNINLKTLSRGF